MPTDSEAKILKPKVHSSVFIAEGVRIYGDVEIKAGASIWFNAVIRGDEGKITIGENTNIQDNCVIHSDQDVAVEIGDNVTVGHGAIVRGCRIGSNCMIGMNATIMNNAEIGGGSIVGTNAMVAYNKKFPPRSLIMGIPARQVRELSEQELRVTTLAPEIYGQLVAKYQDGTIVGYKPE